MIPPNYSRNMHGRGIGREVWDRNESKGSRTEDKGNRTKDTGKEEMTVHFSTSVPVHEDTGRRRQKHLNLAASPVSGHLYCTTHAGMPQSGDAFFTEFSVASMIASYTP